MLKGVNGFNCMADEPVFVTKSFLPPRAEFDALIDEVWASNQLTNNGVLSERFAEEVCTYLGIDKNRFVFVGNGTLALQLALHQLVDDVAGAEIITTPFTYVATTSAILWEKYTPVFVDIRQDNFTIDPAKVEAAITPKTKAILAVHVFGNPCDVEAIELIAKKHNLKVIYDAAHAFGVLYKGKSILEYGDASTLSFHATKLMHTIEGGAVYTKSAGDAKVVELAKRFGHNGDTHLQLGINAKANEFQAAMGLANLKYIKDNIAKRKNLAAMYDSLLSEKITRPTVRQDVEYNYAYYPVVLKDESQTERVLEALGKKNIFPRRYFYPSLNQLDYLPVGVNVCPVSEDISMRIICLPFYESITEEVIKGICEAVNETII